jgi:hypothetical protein
MASLVKGPSELYQAAKRGCMIAGSDRACVPLLYFALRFDSPDDDPLGTHIVWGAKAKPSAPAHQPPGGFAVNQQREIIVKQLLIVLFASAAVITSANAHGWKQQHVCHQHGAYGYHCHP